MELIADQGIRFCKWSRRSGKTSFIIQESKWWAEKAGPVFIFVPYEKQASELRSQMKGSTGIHIWGIKSFLYDRNSLRGTKYNRVDVYFDDIYHMSQEDIDSIMEQLNLHTDVFRTTIMGTPTKPDDVRTIKQKRIETITTTKIEEVVLA